MSSDILTYRNIKYSAFVLNQADELEAMAHALEKSLGLDANGVAPDGHVCETYKEILRLIDEDKTAACLV